MTKPTYIIDKYSLVGETITSAVFDSRYCYLGFESGHRAIIEIDFAWECTDSELTLQQEEPSLGQLHTAKWISEEAYRAAEKDLQRKYAKEREETRRRQYEKLKKEFG